MLSFRAYLYAFQYQFRRFRQGEVAARQRVFVGEPLRTDRDRFVSGGLWNLTLYNGEGTMGSLWARKGSAEEMLCL